MGSTIQKTGNLWSNGWSDWESILHIQCRCIWEWTNVEQIGPMRHQWEHFDVGLSRGNFWGFRRVNISSKVWGMP